MPIKNVSDVTFGRVAPCIAVRDLEFALSFYTGVLGLEKVFQNGNPVGFVVLKKDAAELHLSVQRNHRPSRTNVAHLFVDDVQTVHDACVRAGVRILKGLAQKDYGQDAFVVADPDGNRIDVGQRR